MKRRLSRNLHEINAIDIVNPANQGALNAPFPVNSVASITPLNYISGGTKPHQRIGNKVLLKYLHIKGLYTATYNFLPLFEPQMSRLLLVYDTSPNGALPTFDEIFSSSCNSLGDDISTSYLAQLKFDATTRFCVLWEKFTVLPSMGSISSSKTTGRLDLKHELPPVDPPVDPPLPPVFEDGLQSQMIGSLFYQDRQTTYTDTLKMESTELKFDTNLSPISATGSGTLSTAGSHSLSGGLTGTSILPVSLVCEFGISGPGTIGLPLQGLSNNSTLTSGGTATGSISGFRYLDFSGTAPSEGSLKSNFVGTTLESPLYTEDRPVDIMESDTLQKGLLQMRDIVTHTGPDDPLGGEPSFTYLNTGIITATNNDLFLDEKIQLKQLPSVYSKDYVDDPLLPGAKLPVDITCLATGALYLVSVGNVEQNKEPWCVRLNMRLIYDDC